MSDLPEAHVTGERGDESLDNMRETNENPTIVEHGME